MSRAVERIRATSALEGLDVREVLAVEAPEVPAVRLVEVPGNPHLLAEVLANKAGRALIGIVHDLW